MRAILVNTPGSSSQLIYGESTRPTPSRDEILIKIFYTAVNRADTLQRQGRYNPPAGATNIMGLECVGEVVELGESVTTFKQGDRVMALLPGGGYAQYTTCHYGSAMKIPDTLTYESAAAITEVYLTGFMISRLLGGLKEGDIVLIHAGASGVGTALIQLCTYFKAGGIIVTVGSDEKADYCKKLGATCAINYKTNKNWSALVLDYCRSLKQTGVQLVLDPVGASHAHENLASLSLDGRWIFYGSMGGVEVEKFPLGVILQKRIRLEGTTLRSRSLDYKANLVKQFEKECMEGIRTGILKPIIDRSYTLKEMKQAHDHMESNESIGKITIKVEHE